MKSSFLLNHQLETQKYPLLYAQRGKYVSRLSLDKKLTAHNGCINTISWSDTNCNYILSGSDDQHLTITDAFNGQKKTSIHTGHRANIFSAKFLPESNDERIVSCSADGAIYLTDITCSETVNSQHCFCCHGNKTCYEIRTFVHDPFLFVSCGQDGSCKWVDLRQSSKCVQQSCREHTLIKLSTGISALAINPYVPYHMVCAGLDGTVRFYDRRMLSVGAYDNVETVSILTDQSTKGLFATFSAANSEANTPTRSCNIPGNTVVSNKRITSLQYDNWGSQLLVSYQTDKIYLLDWRDLSMDNKYEANELQESEMSNSQLSSEPERKFRIQTDWSDTGPNSLPLESSNGSDPRSALMRRLNDWFSDLYQNRSGDTNTTAANTQQTTATSQTVNVASTSMATNEATPNVNNITSNNTRVKRNSPTNESPENEMDDEQNETSMPTQRPKPLLSPITSNLMCSRIRSKQALRLETNIINKQPSPKIKMVFSGHRNVRTMIKECNFWGDDHVISGSDCGHIFFWDKCTGKIVNVIEADQRVVNCIQENPLYPVLASSGIDYDIKVWQPVLQDPVDDITSKINLIVERNKQMLNENRNTIFIPVQFMVPALRMFGANMRGNGAFAPIASNASETRESSE